MFGVSKMENWLQNFLTEAIRKDLCTWIMCRTCGARDFRSGLLDALARSTGQQQLTLRMGRDSAIAITRSLRSVQPPPRPSPAPPQPGITPEEREGVRRAQLAAERAWWRAELEWEDAVRLILFDAWIALGEQTAPLELILAGTWAEGVLEGMKAHYQAKLDRLARHEERHNPEKVRARREQKKLLRQQRHYQIPRIINVSPDEVVSLHLAGAMTARSAVRTVMLEWSKERRENARVAGEVVILREGEPSTLRIGDIKQLWSSPEFRDD
jgi:hypothetical protein